VVNTRLLFLENLEHRKAHLGLPLVGRTCVTLWCSQMGKRLSQRRATCAGELIDLFWFNVRHPEGICRQQKQKQQQPVHVQIKKNPGGLSNIPPYTKNRKTHSDWCSRADVATENRWTVNMPSFNRVVHIIFYWVSIVHTILPSFTLPLFFFTSLAWQRTRVF
jgi:hypothetical protein